MDDASRWKKLVRLVGSTKNSSEVVVRLFIDDATNEHFITLGSGKTVESHNGRSFEQIIDDIPDVCRFCHERNCYCCPECGYFVAKHKQGCKSDPK